MTNPTPDQSRLAREIAEQVVAEDFDPEDAFLLMALRAVASRSTLAAIIEVTERAAATCEIRGHVTSATSLRNGEHLK